MAKYVPEGSFLYCDKGVIPTPFRITEYAEVSLTDVPIATDENKKGLFNVIPFGICAVKGGQPCMPATNNQMWINMSENVCVGPGEALLDKSELPCTQGGTIKIAPSFLHALTDMYDDPSEMFDKMVDMLKGTGENVLTAAKGAGKGLWGLVTFAFDIVKFPIVEGWTAITDFDQFKDNWGSRYNSAKDFGEAALEKGKQLYGLATDPDARAAMWAYMSDPDVWEQAFDGVYSAVSEMDNTQIAEFGGQMAFEVLLGVFTGGMGASRHIAKTDDVFRAAQALENLDDFGDVGRALENLDDIDDIIPEELLDDIDDVPGGQTILGQADDFAPGSPAHKSKRWEEYQERGGEWSYERWSKTYDNNMHRARVANQAVDDYHETLGWGKREVTVDVEGQARRLDIADVDAMKGVEMKSGNYFSRTEDIRSEIARDRKLVEQGWEIDWVIEGRASQPLIDELKDAGINVIQK